MVDTELSTRLATRLKKARLSRSLSLEALAKLSGVSRSMLSQIERGQSSPTVVVLWNLTQALNIDFSGLVELAPAERSPIREVIRADQVPVIKSANNGCKIRILSSPETVGGTEIYDLEFDSNGVLDSAAHRSGCVENLTVISGQLTVTSDGVSELARKGDTIRYAADRAHSIKARGRAGRAILVVIGS